MVSRALSCLLLIIGLCCGACTPSVPPAPPLVFPTRAPAQPATHQITLTVLAAASLTESFGELGKIFEAQHPNVSVAFNFAGSQQLAQQLSQGAGADVFASAGQKYMDVVVAAERVQPGSVRIFARNRLVVITPRDNPAHLSKLQDLANASLKLDLADKSVPVGQYTLDFLDKAANDPAFAPDFKGRVLENVVSYEDSVKAVFTKVALGEADAGIVYVTDITPQASGQVSKLEIPDALNTIAVYPIAPIAGSPNIDLAKAFVALVRSPSGQQVLVAYGFMSTSAEAAP
jgi:molybdate transport system substrate-binding protein